jgi:hypothetical protein
MASMGEQTVRRYAPLLVAALVLVAVGGTWAVLHMGRSSTSPGAAGLGPAEPLRLVGWTPAGDGPADPRYTLADGADLPDGPGSVAVHRVEPRDDDVESLRSALAGLAVTLAVQPDGQWSATGTRGGCGVALPPDTAVSSGASTAVDLPCSRAEGRDAEPTGTAPLPGRDAVLEALGLSGEQTHAVTRVRQPDGSELYALDPVVSGLPTSGLRTTLVGATDGTSVTSAAGWLVRTPELADYPVVTAAEAYQLLRRTPLPMPLIACPEPLPEGTDPVPCGGPISITGARLGLSLQQSASGNLLLPAWFFTVAGSDNPLVQAAVEPRLLRPAPAGGGTTPGSVGSAVPPATPSAVPVPPSAGPGEPVPDPQSRFTAVSRGDDDRSLDVTFWGGVEACYAYDVRAEEDAQRVRIRLVERTPRSDKPCIDLAQERHATVRLQQPLGLRTVEDGDSGRVLLGPAR